MAEVFISYSSNDREQVLSIVSNLQRTGVDVWIDRYKIAGGSNWGQEIVKNIKVCKAVVLMATNNSLNSDHVAKEISLASDENKRIIPVMLQPKLSDIHKISYWLAGLQKIQAHTEFETWSEELLEALQIAGVAVSDNHEKGQIPTGEAVGSEAPVITCLMAHLADRDEQERQIFMALENHLDHRPGRPIVFVLHGRATQCIDEFVRRLHLHTLRKQLVLLNLPDQLAWELVPWPKPLAIGQRDPAGERARAYRFGLNVRLRLRFSDGIEAVHRRLANLRSPVGLWSLIPSEHWQPEEPALIDEVLRLWSELPDVPQPLLLFLVIAYRESERSTLARWFGLRPGPEIRKIVAAIEQFGPYNLAVAVLPELADITQAECEHWIRDVLRPTDIERAMQQLRRSFRGERLGPDQGVPMERLVPMLNALVPSATALRGL